MELASSPNQNLAVGTRGVGGVNTVAVASMSSLTHSPANGDDETVVTTADKTGSAKKASAVTGSAFALEFLPTTGDPTPHLAPLRDNHSNYAAVTKACLFLNGFASSGTLASSIDSQTVALSTLVHDPSYVQIIETAFTSLIECVQTHEDRLCRILACKTLAMVARASYAQIRHPLLFSIRDSTTHSLEDQVGSDVPVALCSAALEDVDDGVSACAVEALGLLTLSGTSTSGTCVEDHLLREINAIAFGRPAPNSPSLQALSDEDPSVALMELQCRIYENVMAPRLWRLVARVMHYESCEQQMKTLGFITACLVHLLQATPSLIFGMDRATYAKRWVDIDTVGLVHDLVHSLLLPSMQSGALETGMAYAAALSGLRLANACPTSSWVSEVCSWAVVTLKEEASSTSSLELKLGALAGLVVALRAVTFPQRASLLESVLDQLRSLPATTMAPIGITSPGMLVEEPPPGRSCYRRPARIAFLTELALSFLVDGPLDASSNSVHVRSESLATFLKGPTVSAIWLEFPTAPTFSPLRDELVLAFCQATKSVGKRHLLAAVEDSSATYALGLEFKEWIKMAVAVLTAFAPVVCWNTVEGDKLSMTTAAQAAFVGLFELLIFSMGFVSPSQSVSLNLIPLPVSPDGLPWEPLAEDAAFLKICQPVGRVESVHDEITKLTGIFIQSFLGQQKSSSHHVRMFLLTLLVDQWVEARKQAVMIAAADQPVSAGELDMPTARELLARLSSEMALIAGKAEALKGGTGNKAELVRRARYLAGMSKACVAAVENIALAASDWGQRRDAHVESAHIVILSLAVLKGKDLTADESVPKNIIANLPLCVAAAERIQSLGRIDDGKFVDKNVPFAVSPLLKDQVDNEEDYKPTISVSIPVGKVTEDDYMLGYWLVYAIQLIQLRIDLSLYSLGQFAVASRVKNSLRLTVPPQLKPSARFGPTIPWDTSVSYLSGSSDAVTLTLGYSLRRCFRYDSEDEYRLVLALKVHNITAVEIPKGLKLKLAISRSADDSDDADSPLFIEIAKSLGKSEGTSSSELASAIAIFKNAIPSGDHLTWEITLESMPVLGSIVLRPAVTFRSVEYEPPYNRWVGTNEGGDESVHGEDDGSTASNSQHEFEEEESEDIAFDMDPFALSPMAGLQPCPLVFFRGSPDISAFRFFWTRMAFQVPPLKLLVKAGASKEIQDAGGRLAALAQVRFDGTNGIQKGWAFMSMGGKRVLCLLTATASERHLHIRGDDSSVLLSLSGSVRALEQVVAAFVPGMRPAV